MNATRAFVPVAVLALLALGACKSSKGCPPSACAPPPLQTPCPPTYQAPPPMAYAPPAPPEMSDTERAELDTLRQTAAMSREQAQRERQLREAAEAHAREMEDKWRTTAATPPRSAAGSGESEAAKFVESLRSRCDAEVVQSGSMVTIRMYDSFRSGSKDLKGDVTLATTLQAAAAALAEAPSAQISVVGHTDTTPIKKSKWKDNTDLSRARADTVARVLSENGVSHPISVEGRGESEPIVYPEQSKSDQARNRRVEILVNFS